MSEQITSAMLDELERQLGRYSSPIDVGLQMYPRSWFVSLIAAARRAERYETALRDIEHWRHMDDDWPYCCPACRARAALTPESPTIAP